MKLTFHGGAKAVTGANYLLENERGKILVDCGLRQGGRYCEKENWEPFLYDPASVDALFVTHGHIDHIGRIPKLVKDGFRGAIYSTPPTRDIAEHLLFDSEHILNGDAREHNLPPLYTPADTKKALSLWRAMPYREKVRVDGYEAEFFDAGHVLGSSFIAITTNDGKRIVFSGDLGNSPAPLIKPLETIESADYALIESTYGGRVHEGRDERKDILEDAVEETVRAGGVLMIPAFALERTQELLYELNELVENGRIPEVPVYIDSPLAIKLTAVYKKYARDEMYFNKSAIADLRAGDAIFDFPGLHLTLTSEESKAIRNVLPPKVILAGAGMSQGGRIVYHEKAYLPDPKSTILFVGYQAQGSPGRAIFDGAKTIKIFGEKVPVKARVIAVGGYSAHADQPALLNWLSPMRKTLTKVFVVQGEEDQAESLKDRIRDELAVHAVIPSPGEEVVL